MSDDVSRFNKDIKMSSLLGLREFRLDLQRGREALLSEMLKYNINPGAISPSHKCWDDLDDAGKPVLYRLEYGAATLCLRCGRTHQCAGRAFASPRREDDDASPSDPDPCTVFQEEGHYVCLLTGRIVEDLGAVYYTAGSFAEYEEQHTASGITEDEQPGQAGSSVHDATLEYHAAQFTSDHGLRNRKSSALVQARRHGDAARDARRIERLHAEQEAFTAKSWPGAVTASSETESSEMPSKPLRRPALHMGYEPSSTTAFGASAPASTRSGAAAANSRDVNYWANVVFGRGESLIPRLFDVPATELAALRALFRPAAPTPRRDSPARPRQRHYKVGHALRVFHRRRSETQEVDVEWMWAVKAQLERFFEWAIPALHEAGLATPLHPPPICSYLDILGRWARLVMLTRNTKTRTLDVLPPMRAMVAFFLEFAAKDITVYNGQGHAVPLFQADAWAMCLVQHCVLQQAVFHADLTRTGEAALNQDEEFTTAQLVDRIWQASGPTAASALPPSARRALFAGALDEHATVAQIKKTISDMQEQLRRAQTSGMALWEWFYGAATQTWPLR